MNVCHERLSVFKYISSAVNTKIYSTSIILKSPDIVYTVVETVKKLIFKIQDSSIVEYAAVLIGKYHS
jgi:hypothetical protein